MSESDNKRIAKNTVFLYIRMGISMVISLYTSRVILQILGVTDLGIYNVVGGITSIFSWLSGSLTNSTQRFLNFEIGSNNDKHLNNVFNQSFWIYVILTVLSLIVLEIVGSWMIHHELVIPEGRIDGAIWTLHATSFTLGVTLIGTVYDSVLIARENMKIYAYIGLIDVILKLGIVYLLLLFPYDKLKVYAVLLSSVFVTSKLVTILYCHHKYSECRLKLYWSRPLVKEMGSFAGWNLVGTVVFILNNQGLDILLNMFFGPVVNAAKAITNQIRNVILNFSGNFLTAVRPQIVKNYASGKIEEFLSLTFKSSKYLFYISWILGLAIMIRCADLLKLWLKTVPDYTSPFTIWVIIFILVNVLCDPINTAFQAIGKQKRYIIVGSLVYFMAFPLSYFAIKLEYSPVICFVILAIIRFIYLLAIIKVLKRFITFDFKEYMEDVLLPILKVIIINLIIIIPINSILPHNWWSTISLIILSLLINTIIIISLGLNIKERTLIFKKLKLNHFIN